MCVCSSQNTHTCGGPGNSKPMLIAAWGVFTTANWPVADCQQSTLCILQRKKIRGSKCFVALMCAYCWHYKPFEWTYLLSGAKGHLKGIYTFFFFIGRCCRDTLPGRDDIIWIQYKAAFCSFTFIPFHADFYSVFDLRAGSKLSWNQQVNKCFEQT